MLYGYLKYDLIFMDLILLGGNQNVVFPEKKDSNFPYKNPIRNTQNNRLIKILQPSFMIFENGHQDLVWIK